ncbi:hypothetical protein C8F01DRAFT_756397 [Mycena amicta]|nr:hypothetical protein C8F01DRAFT_756397 [Mycena amicta]
MVQMQISSLFSTTMEGRAPSDLKLSFEIERAIFQVALDMHPEMRTTLRLVCRRAAQWISKLPRYLPYSTLGENTPSVAPQRRLPPELEHIIFTLVASNHPEMHSALNLVCHRVKQWIEPFEMQCLFLATPLRPQHWLVRKRCHWQHFLIPQLNAFLQRRPRIANGVRGLMLGWDILDDPSPIYAALPSLEYIVYGMRHRTVMALPGFSLGTIFSLPIRRLGFNGLGTETLQGFAVAWARQPAPLSSTLTHLELPCFSTLGTYVEALPALSHLSIDLNQYRDLTLFMKALEPHRRLLRRLMARDSFLLLVLRILSHKIRFFHPLVIYTLLIKWRALPTEKVICLETPIDAPLGLCHYYTQVTDMWCEAEAAMGVKR